MSDKYRISAADLASALQAKKTADPKFSPEKFLNRTTGALPASFAEKDIGAADIKAVQRKLKAEFEAAAEHWKEWKPVNYPGKERRPANPDR